MVHALRNFMNSQRGLVILGIALVGITIALPLIHAQTSNTRPVAAGTATDVACAAPCISAGEIAAGAVSGGVGGVISDGTITGADIAALGIDASGDFAAGVVDSAALADAISLPTSLTLGGGTVLTKVTVNQLADGTSGWIPDGALLTFTITATAADIEADSVIMISLDGNTAGGACYVADVSANTNFVVKCSTAPANLSTLNYAIINIVDAP